jgi:hypothetical protein
MGTHATVTRHARDGSGSAAGRGRPWGVAPMRTRASGSWAGFAVVALLIGLLAPSSARAGASGVDLWFYNDITDFGIVAVGSTLTKVIAYQNDGETATLDVFIQSDSQHFSVPATVDVPAHSGGEFEVSFAPTATGQFGPGIVLSVGDEAWVTWVAGIAVSPAPDNQEDAVPIVVAEGETYLFSTLANWATTSAFEAQCDVHNGMWFSYAADKDMVITLINDGGWVGQVIDDQLQGCSGGGWQYFKVPAGKTAYFFTGPAGAPGWFDLSARVRPLSHISVNVDAKATVTKTGAIAITGAGINTPAGDTVLTITARQRSGHGYISAVSGPWAFWMTPAGTPFSFTLAPDKGKFVAGPIEVHVEAVDVAGNVFGELTVDTTLKAVVKK